MLSKLGVFSVNVSCLQQLVKVRVSYFLSCDSSSPSPTHKPGTAVRQVCGCRVDLGEGVAHEARAVKLLGLITTSARRKFLVLARGVWYVDWIHIYGCEHVDPSAPIWWSLDSSDVTLTCDIKEWPPNTVA